MRADLLSGRMLHRGLACVLLLLCWTRVAAAQLAPGSWSARSNTGLVLMGTYTAAVDSSSGAVIGGWTLLDASGREVARGGWSAAKAARTWNGSWRAVGTGSTREWAGTFTADTKASPSMPLRALFVEALTDVVRGTWRTGPYSGSWAIRVAPPQ